MARRAAERASTPAAAAVLIWVACVSLMAAAFGQSAAGDSQQFSNATSRYVLQFRVPVPGAEGLLWSEVEVRRPDGRRQSIRSAPAPVAEKVFDAFSWRGGDDEVERDDLWSPDGRFVALRESACMWLPGEASPLTCHGHQIALVALDHPQDPACGLRVGRYSFSGWVEGEPHSALYSPMLDGEIRKVDLGSCPPVDVQIQKPSSR